MNAASQRSPTSASSPTARRRSRRRAGSIRSCWRCSNAGSCGCRRSRSAPRTSPRSRSSSSASTRGGLARSSRRFPRQSMKRLRRYRWPGDVRELQSLIERAVTSAREPVLEIDAALLDEGVPLGHYRLMEKLGEGGMGEVWRARHQLLARPCAIKLIRPGAARREQPRGGDRALPSRSADDCALDLAEHRAALRFRRQRDGQLLLRHGAAHRHGPRVAGRAFRPAAAGARRGRAASGLPFSRRGARRRAPAPRHQAPEPVPVPARVSISTS